MTNTVPKEQHTKLAAECASLLLTNNKMADDLRECRKVAHDLRKAREGFRSGGSLTSKSGVIVTREWMDRIIKALEGSGP